MHLGYGNFLQLGGRSFFQDCYAKQGPGGGMHIAGSLRHVAAGLQLGNSNQVTITGMYISIYIYIE